MKIVVIGGSGLIGSAVVKEFSERHQIVVVGRNEADVRCDLTDSQSIEKMFKQIPDIDAVVVAAGNVHFEELSKMTPEKYSIGLNDKLMGQVNLVIIGSNYVKDRGSFTLVSGVLSHDPIVAGSSASMVNGAIDSFVRAAAIELPRQLRINAVSPTVVSESMDKYGSFFRGFASVPVSKVALAYSKSVEGHQTGQVYFVE